MRLFAVRWIADERITALRDDVAKLLDGPQPSPQYYLAVLGRDRLARPRAEPSRSRHRRRAAGARTEKRQALAGSPRAWPLRCSRPTTNSSPSTAATTICSPSTYRCGWKRCARSHSNEPEASFACWLTVAGDESQTDEVRAEAIVGLAAVAESTAKCWTSSPASDNRDYCSAKRSAHLAFSSCGQRRTKRNRPPKIWLRGTSYLSTRATLPPAGGCFSAPSARAAACATSTPAAAAIRPRPHAHRPQHVARANHRLDPAAEPGNRARLSAVDAHHHRRQDVHGLRLPEGRRRRQGGVHRFRRQDVHARQRRNRRSPRGSPKSIMPDNLQSTLSIDDLRDLITFLTTAPVNN